MVIHNRFGILMIAVAMGAGCLQAANSLTINPATISVVCDTSTGPGTPVSVVVQPVAPLAGNATLNVSLGTLAGGVVVTAPASQILSATTTSLTYSFSFRNGCVGASTSAAATQTVQFKVGSTLDATVRLNATVTTSASPLAPSPSAVTITCVKNGTVYLPGAAQTVLVTSAATGGTAFKIDNSAANLPTWLTVLPAPPGSFTANSAAASFTVAPSTGCGGFAANTTHSTTLHLQNAPAPDKLLPVALQVLPPSPVTAAPSSVSLSYVKGSGVAGFSDVRLTSNSQTTSYFTMDTATFPIWLTVDIAAGAAPQTVRFSSTGIADSLAPGTYNAIVLVRVAGSGDYSLPVSLLVANAPPTLSVVGGTTQNINWTIGQPVPVLYLTAISSSATIPYSLTTGGALQPQVATNQLAGLAYSYGTVIPVTFSPTVFATAQAGATIAGDVTFTWGSPTSILRVDIVVTVKSAPAKVTGLTPANLPVGVAGPFSLVLSGSGFVASIDPLQKTVVGIVSNNTIAADAAIAWSVINPSSILLTISTGVVGSTLPFSGAGGSVVLGVCNPDGTGCTLPTGTATLAIVNTPIVQAATSSSSFQQVTPPANPTVAPYDLISVFGVNFCPSGCGGATVLAATPDPSTQRYPTYLSPDAGPNPTRVLSVRLQSHADATFIANATLLYATDRQINMIVPAGVSAYLGSGTVDMVVSFNTGLAVLNSPPFTLNIQATDPGIFTLGSDGQGAGAILGPAWQLISFGQEGGMRTTQADSDVVQIYMTGLGVPDSNADNSVAGTAAAWSTDCISLTGYLSAVNALTSNSFTTMDGMVVQSAILNSRRLPPCVTTNSKNRPSVTIGGVAGTVKYAGWVSDGIVGLYQINVQLPSRTGTFVDYLGNTLANITTPTILPVVVTANGARSQPGVTMWVAPRLKVVAPSAPTNLVGTVGVPWNNGTASNTNIVASQGTGAYFYMITSGSLPTGLNLDVNQGYISGTPAAGTSGSYTITVTVVDSAPIPVRGSVTFTITIQGGLLVYPIYSAGCAYGTASTFTQLSVSGGVAPYSFSVVSPTPVPAGIAVDNGGNVTCSGTTAAGTYRLSVRAVDANGLPGTTTYDAVVSLLLSTSPAAPTINSAGGQVATVSATGNTGTVAYSIDPSSPAGFSVNAGGVVSVSAAAIAAMNIASGGSQTVWVTVVAADDTKPASAQTAATGSISFPVTITNP